MDGQHESHGGRYAYSSEEWPEVYDLWIESLFGVRPLDDAAVYRSALEESLNRASNSEEVTLLDLGTGTGRVVLNLAAAVTQSARVRFIGVDHSKEMLKRAERKSSGQSISPAESVVATHIAKPQWLLASASDFVDRFPYLANQVDVLTFASGSICHLTADDELARFLKQVRKALRDKGGSVAVVSILYEFIPGTDEYNSSISSSNTGEQDITIMSKDSPGLVYTRSPTMSSWNGNIRTDKFSVTASSQESGELWHKEMAWSVKKFDELVWREQVEGSSLKIRSVKEGLIQRWYLLELAGP